MIINKDNSVLKQWCTEGFGQRGALLAPKNIFIPLMWYFLPLPKPCGGSKVKGNKRKSTLTSIYFKIRIGILYSTMHFYGNCRDFKLILHKSKWGRR